jgi:nitrate reductase delta subunit
MQILKIISLLMDYPNSELKEGHAELVPLIRSAREISPEMRENLLETLSCVYSNDLMDAQEAYTSLFDRGRSLSLLFFEHVHGESRDRGQAMVDLMAQYETKGFAINVKELPDYIPLYLEYLAAQEDLEARSGLVDVAHIFGLLKARLEERESPYSHLFAALMQISGVRLDEAELREKVSKEERDDTMEALDKVWEEEAVTFGAGDTAEACPSQTAGRPSTLKQPIEEAVHFVNSANSK